MLLHLNMLQRLKMQWLGWASWISVVLTSKSIDSEFVCSYRLYSVATLGGYFLYKALIFDDVGVLINTGSGVATGGAQGARAPPSALGLVDIIVYRTALSSTPLATLNRNLLQNNSLEDA